MQGVLAVLKAGMAAASETHTQWWWLMDDDCLPDSDSLAHLFRVVSDGPEDVGAAVPRVMYSNGDERCGYVRPDFNDKQQITRDAREVDWAPFVGLLLRSAACREVGAVRSDFFISHDDKEYCLRMRMNGWTLRAAPRAVVRHPRGTKLTHRIFGIEVAAKNSAPWREYYSVRNGVIVDRLTGNSAVGSGRSLPRLVVAEVRMLARLMLRPRANGRRAWMGHLD